VQQQFGKCNSSRLNQFGLKQQYMYNIYLHLLQYIKSDAFRSKEDSAGSLSEI